ncbi:glycoside hydrolase family 13 protein [Kordiimonas lacus]|uniref:Glycosidase n=1 Tax=Kordiimonas lacus TaxID=637679 RepID=A0A1G7ASN2_9PROT|nr:glycoside hydrolase family 13 protein [Kordiimonas lacus]SDE17742.1 Glycosidase [Kordiimonas lacus]
MRISFKAATLSALITFQVQADDAVHFDKTRYQTAEDKTLSAVMAAREADWRNGAIVYQVIVDRFAPSLNLEAKRHLYQPPRRLHAWNEVPKPGHPVEGADNWSHELAFWGGDLESLTGRLDYIQGLGVDVLYLNPIHLAITNHKYDALDYTRISPEYGTRDDVKSLARALHSRGMKLVLDGVFNHMGSKAPIFRDALTDANSPYRDWFFIGPAYKNGYRGWIDSPALPELRLENPEVQNYIYKSPTSVVRSYLRDGIDGWRLDVAFDVGPTALQDLRTSAHVEKAGALIVGEVWSYPDGWTQSLDGILNFPVRKIIESLVDGKLDGTTAGRMLGAMVEDTGMDGMLKSWLLLDNHDTKRLVDMMPQAWQRDMAQVLQFTLPGSPNLYYGTELGMHGGEDPENRAPMRWDMATGDNPALRRTQELIALHKGERALRVGNFRTIEATSLLAFERYTEKALETVFVIANPSPAPVTETLMIRNWKMMNGTPVVDALTGKRVAEIRSSLMDITVDAHSVLVLKPADFDNEWSPYERVQ